MKSGTDNSESGPTTSGEYSTGTTGTGKEISALTKAHAWFAIANTLANDTNSTSPLFHDLKKVFKPKEKLPYRECANPNCTNMTNHKRGYCCKECLEDHRNKFRRRSK